MSRLIDADELKKCVLKWLPQDPCGKEEKEFPFETDICVSMLMEIDEQPTAEPKKGKWIHISEEMWKCDQCGEISCCSPNFCPNCGADMREVTT